MSDTITEAEKARLLAALAELQAAVDAFTSRKVKRTLREIRMLRAPTKQRLTAKGADK
jgi:hypothetical protein